MLCTLFFTIKPNNCQKNWLFAKFTKLRHLGRFTAINQKLSDRKHLFTKQKYQNRSRLFRGRGGAPLKEKVRVCVCETDKLKLITESVYCLSPE